MMSVECRVNGELISYIHIQNKGAVEGHPSMCHYEWSMHRFLPDKDPRDSTLRAGQIVHNRSDGHESLVGAIFRTVAAEQPIDAPTDTNDDYRPPSIADGTVSPFLVEVLQELVNEYGAAGVQQTLQELINSRVPQEEDDDHLRPFWPPTPTEEPAGVNVQRLHSTDQADVWAEEFAKIFPDVDQGTMIGWFANCAETAKGLQRQRAKEQVLSYLRTGVEG